MCLVMSSSRDKTKIQKEILDQVLSLYEKRQEDATREETLKDAARRRPSPQKPQEKPRGYEPSPNFYEVFSKLVGEQTPPQEIVHQSKENEIKPVTLSLDKEIDVSQEMQKTEKQEKRLEKTHRTGQPSIFERLYRRSRDDDEVEDVTRVLEKPDVSKELKKSEKQGEELKETNKSTQISVFERLSRRKKEEPL